MASTAIPSEESPLLNNKWPTSAHSNGENVVTGSAIAFDEPTTSYLLKSTVGIFLGELVAAIDSSMIVTLSVPISESFGSLSRLSWLASAFFIATAAVQPLSGKLTDIYGRKNGIILSNIVFVLGNLMCALSQSEWTLICGRFVAGVGGGGIMAITAFILSDLVPLRRRGIWQGLGNMFFGVGSGIGGFIGGWINDTLGWRASFVVQIPITFVAVILIFFTLNIPIIDAETNSKLPRIDFLGASTLFTTLVLMLFALSSGGNIFPWSHPAVLVSLPLSLVSLICFVWVELKYAAEPIIPIVLLWDRSVIGSCLANGFMSMSRFAFLFYLPLFLQIQGYSATEVGLRLVPGSIAITFTTLVCGILVRWNGRYYKIGIFAQLVSLTNIGMAATFNLNTPPWPPFVCFFFASVGFGGMLTTTTLALLSSVQQKHQAVMISAQLAFRSTGTVLGITFASLTFQNVLRQELWKRLGHIEDAAEKIRKIIADVGAIQDLNMPLQKEALQAHMIALRVVFLVLCGIAVVGTMGSFIIKDRKLTNEMSRRPSG